MIKNIKNYFFPNISVRSILHIRTFNHSEISTFVFGQQHLGTQSFFNERFDQCHTIPIDKFPHYDLLNSYEDRSQDYSHYLSYLQASWGYLKNSHENNEYTRMEKVNQYINLYNEIKGSRKIINPIRICKRPDGKFIIIHGNHRASIAYKLKMPIKVILVKPKAFLLKTSCVKGEFYGSGRLSMPYQTIYMGTKKMISGRRSDILERFNKIVKEDIENRNVIDLGCNIGSNCFMAAYFGANSVVGVDNSPRLVSSAIRLNSFFATPCYFFVHDLNKPLSNVEPADTVFCFSVSGHLKTTDNLIKTLRSITKKVLYFEGHPNTKLLDYKDVINKSHFRRIDILGFNRDSMDRSSYTRPFIRCEV